MNTIPNFRGIWSRGLQGPRFPLFAWGDQQTLTPLLGFSSDPNSSTQAPLVTDTINNQVSFPIQVSNISNWRKVILGRRTVIGITDQNTMWGWGANSLILGTYSVTPSRVNLADDWQDFSLDQSSNSTILGIKTNGTLWAWGRNARGQLGLGDTTDRTSPVQVGASGGWIGVSVAFDSWYATNDATTLAIQGTGASGSLWAWGNNDLGQLGIGTTANQSSPVRVGLLNTWRRVYSCGTCSFAIRNDGTLWAWGSNTSGRLGTRNVTNTSSPVQVGTLTDWRKVVCVYRHTIGLRTNGTLWAWGSNNGKVSIAPVFANGILGINPSLASASSPVQIGSATDWSDFEISVVTTNPSILALKTNGTLWVWGTNDNGLLARTGTTLPVLTQVGALTTWTKMAAGENNSFGIRSDGSLWAWGDNSDGRLGIGASPFSIAVSPVRVGSLTGWVDVTTSSHTLAIRSAISNGATSGSLFACGNNGSGELGLRDTIDKSGVVQIGTATDWSVISVSTEQAVGGHSCAIKTNGTLWAWGANSFGQLGAGLTTSSNVSSPVQVGSGSTGPWRKVACSKRSTFGIQQDGTMWSWGYNDSSGRILGRPGAVTSSSPVQIGTLTGWIDIAAGNDHVLAIRSEGTLWGWGSSFYGQIARPTILGSNSPVQIGADTNWQKISASKDTSFGIKTDNTLWGWGRNDYSVLSGSAVLRRSPVQIGAAAGWTAADGGEDHLIALTTAGTLWAIGRASEGQLGVGTSPILVGGLTNPTQITGITASSLVINSRGASNLKGFLKRM